VVECQPDLRAARTGRYVNSLSILKKGGGEGKKPREKVPELSPISLMKQELLSEGKQNANFEFCHRQKKYEEFVVMSHETPTRLGNPVITWKILLLERGTSLRGGA